MHGLLLLALMAGAPGEKTFRLPDGVDLAYVERGKGEPALVFIHCFSCRKEMWTETLAGFAGERRAVALDLPGHGRSGAGRQAWSIPGLGADVAALVEHLKLGRVILVGNSLGGPVALEAAARLGPRRVQGIVAVDTLHNVEQQWPEAEFKATVDAFRADFATTCTNFMLSLLPKDTPAATRERVDRDTCGNDPTAALALFQTVRGHDQAAALRAAGVPVWAINSTAFPSALEVNRRHARSFELILMEGVGHYPQVERPAEFQAHLRRVIQSLAAP
ncbi:MAG TPA: alpha/beta hydrolase, partial [Vicinamibacteria bacterium]|nr:alpha/beta hydrolase [Vicinamibacteria bacterium]